MGQWFSHESSRKGPTIEDGERYRERYGNGGVIGNNLGTRKRFGTRNNGSNWAPPAQHRYAPYRPVESIKQAKWNPPARMEIGIDGRSTAAGGRRSDIHQVYPDLTARAIVRRTAQSSIRLSGVAPGKQMRRVFRDEPSLNRLNSPPLAITSADRDSVIPTDVPVNSLVSTDESKSKRLDTYPMAVADQFNGETALVSATDIHNAENRAESRSELAIDHEANRETLEIREANTSVYTATHRLLPSDDWPPPDVNKHALEVHYLLKRCEYSREVTLSECALNERQWGKVVQSIKRPVLDSAQQDQRRLDLGHLMGLLSQPDVLNIVRYLMALASQWDMEEISRGYLEPFLDSPPSPPKVSKQLQVEVPTTTGSYHVRSFFGAVHAIVHRTLYPNRGLGEYLQTCLVLGKLLGRLIKHLRHSHGYPAMKTSVTTGLVVSLSLDLDCPRSFATIGFSLAGFAGKGNQRSKMRCDRQKNLECLAKDTTKNDEHWIRGNCAEAETFAYVEHFLKSLQENRDEFGPNSELFTPMPFCGHCKEMAKSLGDELSSPIVDLCPL